MRVFIAGASGALGRPLVRRLVAADHEVLGTTTHPERVNELQRLGARGVIVDLLDAEAVDSAVAQAEPDVVVHEATALATLGTPRKLDRAFARTNRLRIEGTDNLLAAAVAAGVGRLVAQSYAGWPYARQGGSVKSEEEPLDPSPPKGFGKTLAAIRHLEQAVLQADGLEGVVLRYGSFYGPGTAFSEGGTYLKALEQRRFPIVGNGAGVWSFVHIDDAAEATAAAITTGSAGVYNIVDDDPAPVSAWLPQLAEAVGAKRPMTLPLWFARLAAGPGAVAMMTEIRGASNSKARNQLDWQPRFPSWREGFTTLRPESRPNT